MLPFAFTTLVSGQVVNIVVMCSNTLGGFKVDSVFHPSEVDKMSTRDFWKLSGKK